jgi:tetratricopeptide (TPR) repeat protein
MVLRRLVLLALVGAITAGCGHTQLLCPRQAGPAWRQYDSPHFAVTTDLAPARARHLVGDFERTYHSFLDITGWHFPGRGEPPGRMRVVVFSRRADYLAVGPAHTDGFYRPESFLGDSTVVLDNDGTHAPGEIFLHELTHRLLRYYVPNTPLGINEGLAEFFSTFKVKDGEAWTGLPPRRIDSVRAGGLPSIDTLFNTENLNDLSPQQVNAFYLGAWFLVHTMVRWYPSQMGGMLAKLAEGKSIRDAYFESFGRQSWWSLRDYYDSAISLAMYTPAGVPVIPSWRQPYREPAGVVGVTDERELGDGALHLLWADLQRGLHPIDAQVTLAASHGSDTAELAFMRALVHAAHGDMAAAEPEMAAAVEARPDEERYHLALSHLRAERLARDPKGTLASMAGDMAWMAANGKTAEAHAVVAIYQALVGDFATALAQAKRALEIDPTNARAYLALALVGDHFGDLDNAIASAVRSVLLTPEGSNSDAARHVLERLRALRGKPLKLHPPTL